MKVLLLFLFGVGAIWDACTTVWGTWTLINNDGVFPLIASVVFAIVILALLASTIWIWRAGGIFGSSFKFAWLVGVVYDLFTSWNGNNDLLFGGTTTGDTQFIMLVGLTIFMTLSPVAWVYVLDHREI